MVSKKISRRNFLYSAGAGAFALVGSRFHQFGRGLSPLSSLMNRPHSAGMEEFVPDAEISITAAEKLVQILPGTQTLVWSYEGQL